MAVIGYQPLFQLSFNNKAKSSSPPFPQAGLATPQDIAYAVLHLTADEASLVPEANLKVDGGRGI